MRASLAQTTEMWYWLVALKKEGFSDKNENRRSNRESKKGARRG